MKVSIHTLLDKISEFWFSPADDRAYACVRVAFAFTSLMQLLLLWPLRYVMLSDSGLIDNSAINGPLVHFTFFHIFTSPLGIDIVLVLSALSMLLLATGYFARWAAIVVFYWHLSLAYDISPASSGYDQVLRLTAFTLLFSPLATRWNIRTVVNGLRTGRYLRVENVPAYGLKLLQLQICLIYLVTVWLKVPDGYWRNGQFTSFFMMSLYSLWPSAMWARMEGLSVFVTYGTLATEAALPFLLWSRRWRWVGVVAGVGLHGGIALTSNLWLFSLSMLMLYLIYFEREDFAFCARGLTVLRKKFGSHHG